MRFSPLALLLFLTALHSCSACRQSVSDRARHQMQYSLDSIEAAMQGQALRDSLDRARAQLLNFRIDSTVQADYNENLASATMYNLYVHETWDKYLELDRKGLAAVVYESTGWIALISTLPDIHELQHNHVEIMVGKNKYVADTTQTRRLTGRDEYGHIAIDNSNGEVTHIADSLSMKIVQDIVAHPDEVVTITASCRKQVYATHTLTDKDRQAIIASYKLLLMIKERNALEGGNVEWDD